MNNSTTFRSKLIYRPHTILTHPTLKFDFKNSDLSLIKKISKELKDEVLNIQGFYKNGCMGLSANQIGYNYNMFIIGKYPLTNRKQIMEIMINAEILETSNELSIKWEGCVSDREYMLLIKRPEWIKLRYFDLTGKEYISQLQPVRSRIAQHEINHCEGIEMYSHEILDKVSLSSFNDQNKYHDWFDREAEKNFLFYFN